MSLGRTVIHFAIRFPAGPHRGVCAGLSERRGCE